MKPLCKRLAAGVSHSDVMTMKNQNTLRAHGWWFEEGLCVDHRQKHVVSCTVYVKGVTVPPAVKKGLDGAILVKRSDHICPYSLLSESGRKFSQMCTVVVGFRAFSFIDCLSLH